MKFARQTKQKARIIRKCMHFPDKQNDMARLKKAAPYRNSRGSFFFRPYYFFCPFSHESFRETVRLNTGFSGVEYLSAQK